MRSNRSPGAGCSKSLEIARRLTWEIASINVHLEEIHQFWARTLGITGPQWMILMAVADADEKLGVPMNVVSKMLHTDPSFVTNQSKILEKEGFLRRKVSSNDARIVLMSLTEKTCKHLSKLAEQQEELNEFVFKVFTDRELNELAGRLSTLKSRLQKACGKLAFDL
jgi:MarR family transcriptional regulator, organic hydroperoxide resistance regulator